jgi:hypothetical protein
MYFANITNGKLNGVSTCRIIQANTFQISITKEMFDNIERYEYENGLIVKIENYEELKAKEERKQEILEELNALDLKSIRALRANEVERLQELENKAIELRSELNSL